ncbi:LysR family transcriptional regulator, glycine cleavage system transcriptional activator [Roseovarius nanhaiticus]|uniref:LysR family transcriptional regulator, glycine cleavage system transcriptional activator n=1 Tax=Roseovarius nanhaiticus TaxID=573024 RepID=A0A1N7H234_9RHOB|nr:LysR family transcriptional regulator [Roseovarius nanhaiticus]SEL15967.1 LysR family transcriptional regulator, glycine cleavage system transcriptional activator [Roseovarius nanhaiticus]SIS18885.1 LysR family transcriptional regulator, glycine cleavage system transcriptional activator [Roseovarius nanhaiticus]
MNWCDLPSLNALRAFSALAQAGSASGAGAALNVSHAAISQQIKALEAHMGLALVRREGRGLALTDEGKHLAAALDEGFGLIAQQVAALTGADAARPLQISTTPQFAAVWLMPRLRDFQTRHPGVDLMVHPSPQRADPAPGGVDLALRFGLGHWDGLEAELLVPTDIVVTAAPSLVGDRQFTTREELLDYPWLTELDQSPASDWMFRAGLELPRGHSITQVPGNLMLDGARAGHGVAVLTASSVEADVAAGRLRILFRDCGETGYFIVTRPGILRPQAKAFRRWLRAQRDVAPAK